MRTGLLTNEVDFTQTESDELFRAMSKQDHLLNDDYLINILKSKKRNRDKDFLAALQYLQSTAHKHQLDNTTQTFFTLIQNARTHATQEGLPHLTELTYRTAMLIEKPKHSGNQAQGLKVANSIQKFTWGQILGGVAVSLFACACGATFMGCLFMISMTCPPAIFVAIPALAKSFLTIGSLILSGIGFTATSVITSPSSKQKSGIEAQGFFCNNTLENAKHKPLDKTKHTQIKPVLRRSASF